MDEKRLPANLRVINAGLIRIDPRLDAKGNLEEDQTCIQCGYMLRGVPFLGPCPECGTPVKRSFMGDLLEYSDPQYVVGLHRGVVLIIAAAGVMLVQMVGLIVAGLLTGTSGTPSGNTGGSMTDGISTAMSIVGVVLHLVGYVFYSRPDPGQMTANKGEKPRRRLRQSLAMQVALYIGSEVMRYTPSIAAIPWMHGAVDIASLTAMVINFHASMVYTQWIARRLPNEALASRAKQFLWLGPCLTLSLACILLVGPIVAVAMYIAIFNTLRKDLKSLREDQGTLGAQIYDDTSRPFAG